MTEQKTAQYHQEKRLKKKQQAIATALENLEATKRNIKRIKRSLAKEHDDYEQRRLLLHLKQFEQRLLTCKERLHTLGYTEKRGRPKKEVTYKTQRIKFTAHLSPESHAYVQQLKADGKIDNISAFFDDLLLQHKSNQE